MKSQSEIGYHFKVGVKVITPLHIGNGIELSPLTDYIYSKGKIHSIDYPKLAKTLTDNSDKDLDLITEYSNFVLKGMATRKDQLLSTFLDKYDLIDDLDKFKLKTYNAYGVNTPVNLKQIIRTDGRSYLPGSSIKGALRSVLLHRWLKENKPYHDKRGTDHLQEWLNSLFAEMEERKVGTLNDQQKRKTASDVDRNFESMVMEPLFGKMTATEVDLSGRLEYNRMSMSCLLVGDSNVINEEHIEIHHLPRKHLTREERQGMRAASIPTLAECISPETKTSFRLDVEKETKTQKLPKILSDLTTAESWATIINSFSLDVIEYELSVISKNQDVLATVIDEYEQQLEEIKHKIQNASSGIAFLRLGFGKMQFYQTAAVALFKYLGSSESNNDWVDYLWYCEDFDSNNPPEPYPITRVMTEDQDRPMGWVELNFNLT